LDLRVELAPQGLGVLEDLLETKARLAQLVHKVRLVLVEHKVCRVQQGQKVTREIREIEA
jgi:hypothetical protein